MPLTRNRLLTLLAEVLIAVALWAAVILYAEVGPFSWMPSLRWWGLAGITGLFFWEAAKLYRRFWRHLSFWLTLAGFFAVHVGAWAVLLLRVDQWGLAWFLPPVFVEAGVLVLVLDRLGSYYTAGDGGRRPSQPPRDGH